MENICHAARRETPQRHANLKNTNLRVRAARRGRRKGCTLNSLVLTMWRLSGHHLLAASLAHARMSTIHHATNDSTHPAAPSSMQHVHAASAMHQTCTAARGSMAHRMYLPHRHAARDAHASAGCTLAVCAPFARCNGVHAHEGSDHSKAGNCAHAELHVDAGGDVSAHSECCARCNCKKCDRDCTRRNLHAVGRELGRAHAFESFGEIHEDL